MGAFKELFSHNRGSSGSSSPTSTPLERPSISSVNSSSSRKSFFKNKNSSSITPFSTRSSNSNQWSNNSAEQEEHVGNGNGTSKPTATPMKVSGSTGSMSSNGSIKRPSLRRFINKLTPRDRTKNFLTGGKSEAIAVNSELFAKYGTLGKLLGAGASGSVNLLTNKEDPTKIYAVKKFRSRLTGESQLDYQLKVKNEFTVGEFAKHENIITTFELIKDFSRVSSKNLDPDYYIIMEYCPFDFFNLVMSGLMEINEVYCYFKQIVNGVWFLHENGIAHRDLKLDNCVVNHFGILKLIDFGSAVSFRKQIPSDYIVTPDDIMLRHDYKLVRAKGVVGSDPYLSPEVLEPGSIGYDPRAADVWSIAIIFCCMILKRFPWKIPKISDPSYRSFVGNALINEQIEQDLSNLSLEEEKLHESRQIKLENNGTSPPQNSGEDRLLRLLPLKSRQIIKNMLTLDPKNRYQMNQVIDDSFVRSIDACSTTSMSEFGVEVVKSAHGDPHHLVTEDDLQKLQQEREKMKKLKEIGIS
ncbi:Serine/threonine-protein kinase [Spathaspora sp. JA1]|nr:Serine/threonine-protein kinase [Spathaspora sp. JA1]